MFTLSRKWMQGRVQVGKPCLILQPCLLHCGRVKLVMSEKILTQTSWVSNPHPNPHVALYLDSPRTVLYTACIWFPFMKWKNRFQVWNRRCLELLPISYERLSFIVTLAIRSDEVITLPYDLQFIHCHSVQALILTSVGGECCGLQFTQRETEIWMRLSQGYFLNM